MIYDKNNERMNGLSNNKMNERLNNSEKNGQMKVNIE